MLQHGVAPSFGYVYLDGVHTWAIDGLAFVLLDRMLRLGGAIEFDDYNHRYEEIVPSRVFQKKAIG